MRRLLLPVGLLALVLLLPLLALRSTAESVTQRRYLPIVRSVRADYPLPSDPPPDPTAPAPIAGQQCPAWVHQRYSTTGPDGQTYASWHPPTDPQYRCWFGHEHGSDPRKFPALATVGMPAFGYTAAQHGMEEPHVGFKVFVVDDHDRGLWWLITFHQGSSGAARAFVHHHTQDIVVVRSGDWTLLADVHLMAETGASKPKCRVSQPGIIPGSGPQVQGTGKAMPTTDCPNDFYESWTTRAAIADLFDFRGSFDMDNAVSALKRLPDGSYSQSEVVYISSLICPEDDPLDPRSDCNRIGDKRALLSPRLVLNNTTGSNTIWTDPYGAPVAAGEGIRQYLHPTIRVRQTSGPPFANGWDDGDIMIYRSIDYCAGYNCNPRNFTDGTVRPPN